MKKKYLGFSFYTNIANSEALLYLGQKVKHKPLFQKNVLTYIHNKFDLFIRLMLTMSDPSKCNKSGYHFEVMPSS